MPVTQFNMKWVEQAGLVKFDFLGLKTLTVLQTAVALVKRRGIDIDLGRIPLDDKNDLRPAGPRRSGRHLPTGKRRACAARSSTCGPTVSRTSSRWSRSIAPARWRTSRPIARASTAWRSRTTSIPKLEPILKETFGVIVYQEQVMQAAQILAGYSLGEADLLAPRHGQEDPQRDAGAARAFRRRLRPNAVSSKAQADAIFDLLERFAEYGFNKSHAAAYALVAYQTAYMKANYPVEFLAASMTLDMGNTDKLVGIPRRGRAAWHQGRSAVDQPLGMSPSRSRATRSSMRSRRSKASASRRLKAIVARAPERRVRRPRRFRRAHQSARRQQARAGKPRRRRRFDEFERNRARVFAARRYRARPRATRPRGSGDRAERIVRRRRQPRDRSCCPRSSLGCRPIGCGANTRRSAFSCPAIRSTTTRRC